MKHLEPFSLDSDILLDTKKFLKVWKDNVLKSEAEYLHSIWLLAAILEKNISGNLNEDIFSEII